MTTCDKCGENYKFTGYNINRKKICDKCKEKTEKENGNK